MKPGKKAIAGVEVVTIPLKEYEELLAARRRLRELLHDRKPTSPIEYDHELQSIIDARLGSMTYKNIAAACRSTFVWNPSTSAIQRYYKRRTV